MVRLCPTKVQECATGQCISWITFLWLGWVGWLVDIVGETIVVDHLSEYEVMGEFGWMDGWRCGYHTVLEYWYWKLG